MKKKEKYILFLLIVFISIFLINYFITNKNDKIKISYRVYSNNKWSAWKNDGQELLINGNSIQDIQVKTKSRLKGTVSYKFYSSSWSKDYFEKNVKTYKFNKSNNYKKDISGIKYVLIDDYNNEFQICYKTYNKKNKWLDWSCESEINGNKNEKITGVKFKIIPKNVIKNEWLEDYNKNYKISNNIGFEEANNEK